MVDGTRVQVKLRRGVPSARAAWDQAHALGLFLLEDRPTLGGIRITVNDNRRSVLSWKPAPPGARVSIHWSLLGHPHEVLRVFKGDERAWQRLRQQLKTSDAPLRQASLRTAGEHHDLDALLPPQLAHAGHPEPAPPLTWGRWPTRAPKRSLRLGSCTSGGAPLIRIHPVLDDATVPEWFVGFIVFHELLHVVHPPEPGETRRNVHTRAFLRAEAKHPDWGRATRWERENIALLIRRTQVEVRSRR